MSTQFNIDNNQANFTSTQGRVKVTDLLSRLNEEKKIEKKKKFSFRCCCSFSSNSFWHNTHNIAHKSYNFTILTKLMI